MHKAAYKPCMSELGGAKGKGVLVNSIIIIFIVLLFSPYSVNAAVNKIIFNSPAPGTAFYVTRGDTITVNITAYDGNIPVNNATVEFKIVDPSGIVVYEFSDEPDTVNGVSADSEKVPCLANGTYNITATVTDILGNSFTNSTPIVIYSDPLPPLNISVLMYDRNGKPLPSGSSIEPGDMLNLTVDILNPADDGKSYWVTPYIEIVNNTYGIEFKMSGSTYNLPDGRSYYSNFSWNSTQSFQYRDSSGVYRVVAWAEYSLYSGGATCRTPLNYTNTFELEPVGIVSLSTSNYTLQQGSNISFSVALLNLLGSDVKGNLSIYAYNGSSTLLYNVSGLVLQPHAYTTLTDIKYNTSGLSPGKYNITARFVYSGGSAERNASRSVAITNVIVKLNLSTSQPFIGENITVSVNATYSNGSAAIGVNVTINTGAATIETKTDSQGVATVSFLIDNSYTIGATYTVEAFVNDGINIGRATAVFSPRSPLIVSVSTDSNYSPGEKVKTKVNITNVAGYTIHITEINRSGIYFSNVMQPDSGVTDSVDIFLHSGRSFEYYLAPWDSSKARSGTYGQNTINIAVKFENSNGFYYIENSTSFNLSRLGVTQIVFLPQQIKPGENATFFIYIKNIGEKTTGTLSVWANSSTGSRLIYKNTSVSVDPYNTTVVGFYNGSSLPEGDYNISAAFVYSGGSANRTAETLLRVTSYVLKEPYYIYARQFPCLSYFIADEYVKMGVVVNMDLASLKFYIWKGGIVYGEYAASQTMPGFWVAEGRLPAPRNLEGWFNMYAVGYDSNGNKVYVSNVSKILILHVVDLAEPIKLSDSIVNYGDSVTINLRVKNIVNTTNPYCNSYYLGVNATVKFYITDKLANTSLLDTFYAPIKPNTTEWYNTSWNTINAVIDQNHSVVAEIFYENRAYGINGSKGGVLIFTSDNVSNYNYSDFFYINPIRVTTHFFLGNVEVTSVSNVTGANISIVPFVDNLGYRNVTVNITVTVYNGSGAQIAQYKWINNVSERRHITPTRTIFTGQTFTLPNNLPQNYTINTTVSYINPDPEANNRKVTLSYNDTLEVKSVSVLTGVQISVNSVSIFKNTTYSDSLIREGRFVRINYSIINSQNKMNGTITAKVYSYSYENYTGSSQPLLTKEENITIYPGVNNYILDLYEIENSLHWGDLLYSDMAYITITLSTPAGVSTYSAFAYNEPYVVFLEPAVNATLSLGDYSYVDVLVRNYTKVISGDDTPIGGLNLNYRVWDSAGNLIAQGSLPEISPLFPGHYRAEIQINTTSLLVEGDAILEVYGKIGDEDFWGYRRLYFTHPLNVSIVSLNTTYEPGDSIPLEINVTNTGNYSVWITRIKRQYIVCENCSEYQPNSAAEEEFNICLQPGDYHIFSLQPWDSSVALNGSYGIQKIRALVYYTNKNTSMAAAMKKEASFTLEPVGITGVNISQQYIQRGENITASISVLNLGIARQVNITLYAWNGSWLKMCEWQNYNLPGHNSAGLLCTYNTSSMRGSYRIMANLTYSGGGATRYSDTNITVNDLLLEINLSNSQPFLTQNLSGFVRVSYFNNTPVVNATVIVSTDVESLTIKTNSTGYGEFEIPLDADYSAGNHTLNAFVQYNSLKAANGTGFSVKSPLVVQISPLGTVYPGEEVAPNITIVNNGSFAVELSKISYRIRHAGSGIEQNNSAGTISYGANVFPAGASTTLSNWVWNTLDAIPGTYGTNTVEVEITYSHSGITITMSNTTTFTLNKVGIANLSFSPSVVKQGDSLNVSLVLINLDTSPATGNLSIYANNTYLGSSQVTAYHYYQAGTKLTPVQLSLPVNITSGSYLISANFTGFASKTTASSLSVVSKLIAISSITLSRTELAYPATTQITLGIYSHENANAQLKIELLNATGEIKGTVHTASLALSPGLNSYVYEWDGKIEGYRLPAGNYTIRATVSGAGDQDTKQTGIEIVNLNISSITVNSTVINGESAVITVTVDNLGFTPVNSGNLSLYISDGTTLYNTFLPENLSSLKFESNPVGTAGNSYSVTWVVGDFNGNPIPLGNYTIEAVLKYGGVEQRLTRQIEVVPGVTKGSIVVVPNVTTPFSNFTVKINITNAEKNRNITIANVTLHPPSGHFVYIYDPVKLTTPVVLSPSQTIEVNWTAFTNETGVISGFRVTLLYNNITIDPSSGSVVVKPNVIMNFSTPNVYPVDAPFQLSAKINVTTVDISSANLTLTLPAGITGESNRTLGSLGVGVHYENLSLKANTPGNYTITGWLNYSIVRNISGTVIAGYYSVNSSATIQIVSSSAPYLYLTVEAPDYWVVSKPLMLNATVVNYGNSTASNLSMNLTSSIKNETRNLSSLKYMDSWNESFSLSFSTPGNYTVNITVGASNANSTTFLKTIQVLNRTTLNITMSYTGALQAGNTINVTLKVKNTGTESARACTLKLGSDTRAAGNILPGGVVSETFSYTLTTSGTLVLTGYAECVNANATANLTLQVTSAPSSGGAVIGGGAGGGGGGGAAAPSPKEAYVPIPEFATPYLDKKLEKADFREIFSRSKLYYTSNKLVYPQENMVVAAVVLSAGGVALPENYSQMFTGKVEKFSARDVYSFAVEFMKKTTLGSRVIIIARGDLPVDAFAAVELAKMTGGKVLLTYTDKLPYETYRTIAQLKPKQIYIIGGEKAVSKEVEETLRKYSYNLVRIGGKDRYETSMLLVKEMSKIKKFKLVIVTSGKNPNPLAPVVSAILNAPVVYYDEGKTEVKEFIDGFEHVIWM